MVVAMVDKRRGNIDGEDTFLGTFEEVGGYYVSRIVLPTGKTRRHVVLVESFLHVDTRNNTREVTSVGESESTGLVASDLSGLKVLSDDRTVSQIVIQRAAEHTAVG